MKQSPDLIALSNDYRQPRRQAGFSLVELMVAMALSIFLIGGVTLTYLSGRATSVETEELSRMQENLRFAADFLVRDIRNAGFRDQLTLIFDQYKQIGESYAEIGPVPGHADITGLTIRYAGRGACGQAFGGDDELKLIENTYFEHSGELKCKGIETMVAVNNDGVVTSTTVKESTVTLASGVTEIVFEFLPDDKTSCTFFDPKQDLPDACDGVRITLTFQGEEKRTAEINAAFRNVIFDKVYKRENI